MKKPALFTHHSRHRVDLYGTLSVDERSRVDLIQTFWQAERNAAAQMRALGYHDARVTRSGADGGFDVVATRALAQVKFRITRATGPDLKQFAGGARGRKEELWFFDHVGYTRYALEFADEHHILLFTYSATGELEAANKWAEKKLGKLLAKRVERLEQRKAFRETRPGGSPARDAMALSLIEEISLLVDELREYSSQEVDDLPLAPVIPIFEAKEVS
jgi:hypothetical protein